MTRSCSLPPSSPFASWPTALLETLCRSYQAHGSKVDGRTIASLPEAFEWGNEKEPADFAEALTKAHVENIKVVYDRAVLHSGLWKFVDFIFENWKSDNCGMVFSMTFENKHSLRSFLDASPRFCRDTPYMQYFHQDHKGAGERVLVPTHQCWREVVNGSPGLHICLKNNDHFNNSVHVDPHQIVTGKYPGICTESAELGGTCQYDLLSMVKHGYDIRKLFGV